MLRFVCQHPASSSLLGASSSAFAASSASLCVLSIGRRYQSSASTGGGAGTGSSKPQPQPTSSRRNSAAWTSLLNDDDDIVQKGIKGKLEKVVRDKIVREGTPTELHHTLGPNVSRKRMAPLSDEEADRERQAAATTAATDATTTSWLNVFSRKKKTKGDQQQEQQRGDEDGDEQQQQQRQQQQDAQEQRRPRVSAVSRFFRDTEARERAARSFEAEDLRQYGSTFRSPTMTRDSAGKMTLEKGAGDDSVDPSSIAAHGGGGLEGKSSAATAYDSAEAPYDAYRINIPGQNTKAMRQQDSLADDRTRAGQSFMPGLGMAQSALQFAMDKASQDGQAANVPKDYAIRRPQIKDSKVSFRKRVFADFDVWDRRSTTHVLTSYNSAEWIFALLSVFIIGYLTDYQFKHMWLSWYDELLGVDMKALGDKSTKSEWLFILVLTLGIYRAFLFHPVALGVIAMVRGFRFSIGLPLGPP